MVSSISITGSRFNTEINTSDIRNIAKSTDRDHVGSSASRLWDKMVDWFCGTDRAEAKKLVFDMVSPRSQTSRKVDAFMQLSEIATGGIRNNFTVHEDALSKSYRISDQGNVLLELNLETDEKYTNEIKSAFSEEISKTKSDMASLTEKGLKNAFPNQFNADLPRFGLNAFSFDGETVTSRDEFFNKLSVEEQASVFTLCHQGVFAELIGQKICFAPSNDIEIAFSRNDSGELEITAYFEKDLAKVEDETEYQILCQQTDSDPALKHSISLKAEFLLDKEGAIKEANSTCYSATAHMVKIGI
ncbi:hypothetical protein [Polycladidibacter stylochi]|uniref:hypothetical protein n=1 Tax=Polycladidibacter stylochi TaxID=1807766 RepID=UPI0008343EE5|nr:hypothetical protein [Pseudovibrio stylochi]